MGGACRTDGSGRGAYRILVGIPDGRPLGKPRPRWDDNIKMDLQEVGSEMDWTDMAQYRDRWRVIMTYFREIFIISHLYSVMEHVFMFSVPRLCD
jgi:hypothetical protein